MMTWHRRSSTVSLWTAAMVLLSLLLVGRPSAGPSGFLLPLVALLAIGVTLWFHRHERLAVERLLRGQAVQHAVVEERLAIARDLHDIISHGLALIAMRSNAAQVTSQGEPAALVAALADIEQSARSASRDLRALLAALRDDEHSLTSIRCLSDVPRLVESAERSGLRVDMQGLDTPIHSCATEIAVYRIIQESLTNTARHAGPVSCSVCLSRSEDAVQVVAVDDGPSRGWRPTLGTGAGLLGLAERVEALGGTLTTCRRERGFSVRAEIPDPLPGE